MPQNFKSLREQAVADLLHAGSVGVLPTDTVYGLVCRAADEQAVARLYKLKARENKPGTLIAANIDQLVQLGFKARYLKAYENFWPNPITIVVPNTITYLNLGKQSQAVRVVKGPKELLDLLEQVGPLMTTSANQPGEPPANTIDEALAYFGETIDFYVDGGDLSGQQPSTIIRVVDDAIEVLRPGAVKVSESGRLS